MVIVAQQSPALMEHMLPTPPQHVSKFISAVLVYFPVNWLLYIAKQQEIGFQPSFLRRKEV